MRNYHDLLVLCSDYQRHDAALALAANLAAQQNVRLTGLHVRWPVPDLEVAVLPGLAERLIAQAQSELDTARRAETGFRSFLEPYGQIEADWRVVEGHPEDELVHFAACHDLVVLPVGQTDPSVTPVFVGQIVLQVRAPCLIVPDSLEMSDSPALDSIAVGWDGSIEVLRAVRGALPLLGRARQVVLLVGSNRRSRDRAAFDLSTWLEARGIATEMQPLRVVPGREGEALLSASRDAGCGLLVMGGYGHSRFREWVLGGATRDVLHTMRMPVLMAH